MSTGHCLPDMVDQQRAVAARFGAEYCPAPSHLKIGIAANVRSGLMPVNGLRHPPEGDTTGWYLWAGEQFSEDPDFFLPVHVEHLAEWCPAIIKYLGLPPGWRFLVADGYEDVWFDETLLAVDQSQGTARISAKAALCSASSDQPTAEATGSCWMGNAGPSPTDEHGYASAIEAHYARIWAPPSRRLRWTEGPVHELPPNFAVLAIHRSEDTTAYATVGMSQADDAERLELHVLTRFDPKPNVALVELMTSVAHYHRTGARLGLGHTVNIGRPWLPGSLCTHGLISLPYLDGPRLEWLDEPRVRLLWLVPVTAAEVEFKRANGLEALEQRFEAAQLDYLDPRRPSVV